MKSPSIPENEIERLKALHAYSILDTLPEEDYDNITSIAAQICKTPISLVTLVDEDRQWFKSSIGLDVKQTARDLAFCAHAINQPKDIFVVSDARSDERFFDNPLVTGQPHVIFYAGMPIVDNRGNALGTICVIDNKPGELNEEQKRTLKALSNQVMRLLELRKSKADLEETIKKLEDKNAELERFIYTAAHDLRAPLHQISQLIEMLQEDYGPLIDTTGQDMMNYMKRSSQKLSGLINGLLEFSKTDKSVSETKCNIEVEIMLRELAELFTYDKTCEVSMQVENKNIFANKIALEQILLNLIANAVKYNDKPVAEILITQSESNNHYLFSVKDNGPGIPEADHEKVFRLFETNSQKDKFGNKGSGIGLATVKSMVEKLGGEIKIKSLANEGCDFIFSLAK